MRKRTFREWIMLGIVVFIASLVIVSSFQNTKLVASDLNTNPWLLAVVIEVLFGMLLFFRASQRATQRNVPWYLEGGYIISFLIVTAVNVYGLAQANLIVGSLMGVAISGAMWLVENILVWLWTESHLPHRKTVKELEREARLEIEETKAIQRIEWMKWEAKKPDLKLIIEARKADEKRKKVVGDGLPEFFLREPEPIPQYEAEPVVIDVDVDTQEKKPGAEIVPIRTIGFHMEESKPKPAPRFEPNLKARKQAIETAKALKEELGRLPKKRELKERGLTDHYSRVALDALETGEA